MFILMSLSFGTVCILFLSSMLIIVHHITDLSVTHFSPILAKTVHTICLVFFFSLNASSPNKQVIQTFKATVSYEINNYIKWNT